MTDNSSFAFDCASRCHLRRLVRRHLGRDAQRRSAVCIVGRRVRSVSKAGRHVLLVTNAPRPRDSVGRQLDRIGVAATAYDEIVSSGDVSRSLIEAWAGRRDSAHRPRARSADLRRTSRTFRAPLRTMPRLQFAPVFTTTRRKRPPIMQRMLAHLKSRAVPMICANPDRKVERGGRIIYCAGAIAAAYEALGGTVSYAGKPFQPIYDLALELGSDSARRVQSRKSACSRSATASRPILPAPCNFGIRAVFIASGVHVGWRSRWLTPRPPRPTVAAERMPSAASPQADRPASLQPG